MKTGFVLDRDRLNADSAALVEYVKRERASRQFLIGSHNSKKLRIACNEAGCPELSDVTLLTPMIHSAHANRLADRYLSHWTNLKSRNAGALSDHALMKKHLRFVTLVDCVTPVDQDQAFNAGINLKSALLKNLESLTGVWFLGVVEFEVVSLEMMDRVSSAVKSEDDETRKLDVCKLLASHVVGSGIANRSYILVHVHGLLSGDSESEITALGVKLEQNPDWQKAARQIEIKHLSEEYFGRSKSVENNLKDIARYITKGGNDWYAGKAYLRYKIGFGNSDSQFLTEEVWIAKNWRIDEALRQEHAEEGLVDILSLTAREIAQLALCIDRMMGTGTDRDGYSVEHCP